MLIKQVKSSHSPVYDPLRPKAFPKLMFYKDISATINSMKAKKKVDFSP